MPKYQTTLANAEFRSRSESEFDDDGHAIEDAVRGAISVVADEVCDGEPLFIAEITIERDGNIVARRAVAVGATTLS